MAGSNTPPKAGSREQLERDNETHVYADKPFSTEGGSVGEADPNIPTLDDAMEEAMRDADPQAYQQGLREDAIISSSRIFAAGSLIAALGRDNIAPDTHSEPTNQASDYTPYGHDEDLQTRIGNEHMAGTAEGKIAGTIGARKADDLYLEEKKREDDRFATYVTAQTVSGIEDSWDTFWDDDDWYEPAMSFDDYSNLVDTFASENQAFNVAAARAIDASNQYIQVEAPRIAAAIDGLEEGHATVLDAPVAPETTHDDRAAAVAAVTTLQDPNANIFEQMRALNDESTKVFEQTKTVYSQASTYFSTLVAETEAFRDRIPKMSGNEARYELTRDIRTVEARIQQFTPDQAKQSLVSEMRSNLERAVSSGDTEAQQLWNARLDHAQSLTGEEAKTELLAEAQRRREQISNMTDSEVKNALQLQAQKQVNFARDAQQQMTVLAGSVPEGQRLTTELADLQAEYLRKNEEYIRKDGGLSAEESAEQEKLLRQMQDKRAELDAYNARAQDNSRGIRDTITVANNNFVLGTKVNAHGQADHLVASMEDLETSQIVQSEIANDAAQTLEDAQQAAADARLGVEAGMRYGAGPHTPQKGPGVRDLTEQQRRDLRQDINALSTNNALNAESLRALAEKYHISNQSVEFMANRMASSASLTAEQNDGLRKEITALSEANTLNATSISALASKYGVTDDYIGQRAEWITGAGSEVTGLDREQRHALRDEIQTLSAGKKLDAQSISQLASKYGISQEGTQKFADFIEKTTDAGRPERTPSLAPVVAAPAEAAVEVCENYNTLDRNVLDFDESIFDFLNEDGPSTVSIFGQSPNSISVMPVTRISEPGYSGSPLMDTSSEVRGGNYVSFADNEFNDTNPSIQETGGITPSYSKPWYSAAWDATSSFMTSVWSGLDSDKAPANATINPLGQSPQVMMAMGDPNKPVLPAAGQSTGGGGGMAA